MVHAKGDAVTESKVFGTGGLRRPPKQSDQLGLPAFSDGDARTATIQDKPTNGAAELKTAGLGETAQHQSGPRLNVVP
jgi:hypothetical protein